MLQLPKPISLAVFDVPAGPTYKQILDETFAPLDASEADNATAHTQLAALTSAMGDASLQATLESSIADATKAHSGLSTATLDGHIGDFIASKPYSDSLVSAAAAGKVPSLLEMPITPDGPYIQFEPPTLTDHDFGTLKLGGNPVTFQIGTTVNTQLGGDTGMVSADIINADQSEWEITQESREHNDGSTRTITFLQVTPLVLGRSVCQVNVLTFIPSKVQIITARVNVVP